MPKKSSRKKPKDVNELAFSIVQQATGEESPPEEPETPSEDSKDPELSDRGRKGGKSRAAKLTPQQRSESARKAANARWKKRKSSSK